MARAYSKENGGSSQPQYLLWIVILILCALAGIFYFFVIRDDEPGERSVSVDGDRLASIEVLQSRQTADDGRQQHVVTARFPDSQADTWQYVVTNDGSADCRQVFESSALPDGPNILARGSMRPLDSGSAVVTLNDDSRFSNRNICIRAFSGDQIHLASYSSNFKLQAISSEPVPPAESEPDTGTVSPSSESGVTVDQQPPAAAPSTRQPDEPAVSPPITPPADSNAGQTSDNSQAPEPAQAGTSLPITYQPKGRDRTLTQNEAATRVGPISFTTNRASDGISITTRANDADIKVWHYVISAEYIKCPSLFETDLITTSPHILRKGEIGKVNARRAYINLPAEFFDKWLCVRGIEDSSAEDYSYRTLRI